MAILTSAGLLLFRRAPHGLDVLLGHLGGPFWERRHEGAWSIPKGVSEPGEELKATARREFTEELGLPVPDGPWLELGSVRQSRKIVHAWALEADLDPTAIVPGTFMLEHPRGSGRTIEVPEIDRVAWFGLDEATELVVTAQRHFLDRLDRIEPERPLGR